ncbi:SPSB1_4 [Lepeophtheirus salmonis]|uniref:SPSB1_4 n=1 Tax=Lepeophtheirus salmonis TaxID=72036 RepID=A0A7R8CNB6_LEPSM|nr:SPSB1_4 [Lepeophtheirus salmonis]CAF2844677.1 SPSB1_4 [Lepeophtheirus salmonis]
MDYNDIDDQNESNESIVDKMPVRLEILLDMPDVPLDIQLMHAWNPDDSSDNILVKEEDRLTFHRQPVAQSTDAIRSKIGYERGLHLFEINWPNRQRGTHAVVGFATDEAPVKCFGYQSLVGNNEFSWGWDIGRNTTFYVPDKFKVVLNMDDGCIGYLVNDRYLGTAFRGLKGKKLYLIASSVWGHCEVSMKYIGGIDPEPLPLRVLCRRVIRVNLTKNGIEDGMIEKLELPLTLYDYLRYKDHLSVTSN